MPSAPYDTLEVIEQAARVRVNDAIVSIGGEIFMDLSVFTPTIVNVAYRRMQEFLADRGFAALTREKILAAVPAWTATDPGTFVWFNWANYFDGTSNQSAPVLPQDLIAPLDLFERVTGSNSIFWKMDQVLQDGLPTANTAGGSAAKRDALNRLWEWRAETVFLPGATGQTDIRLRYAGYIADFSIGAQDMLTGAVNNSVTTMPVASGLTIGTGAVGTGFYIQIDNEAMLVTAGGGTTSLTVTRAVLGTTAAAHASAAIVYVLGNGIAVTIMRCMNSFAWYMASELARLRGDLDAGWFDTQAMDAAQQIWNRDYRPGKALYQRAELNKMTVPDTRTQGANMPPKGETK